MTVTVVVGSQWGDEGKGKITDYLAEGARAVVRYQGGNNAGHTIVIGDRTHKLHLLPSGILRRDVLAVLGNGMVIDPAVLLDELAALGGDHGELLVSERAHVIMPYHRLLDGAEERGRGGAAVGTTGRGIGPCYGDRAMRYGVRIGDLREPSVLRERLAAALPRVKALLRLYHQPADLDADALYHQAIAWGEALEPYIGDASLALARLRREGQQILMEGAQGVHIDLDHGTYPFVTSSHPISGGSTIGAGIPPTAIERVVGVTKAYTTRVGSGPFPAELSGPQGDHLREAGGEYGTTTGRPRRCGWLDLVMLELSHRVCGFTELAVTKLDVLGGLDEVKVAVAYDTPEGRLTHFPASQARLTACEPVHESLPGWPALTREEWLAAAQGGELPSAMRDYLAFISNRLGVSVGLASVGPERAATVELIR